MMNWIPWNKFKWNLDKNEAIFIKGSHFENVHLKQKIDNLTILSSLGALQVVITTIYGATSDDKVINLTIFSFECLPKTAAIFSRP